MARVDIKIPRQQKSHFGLYRTSAGGDESVIVRRKVGEPTDYVHGKSRKLKVLRHHLTLASQHYAHLTPSQKAITRHQFEEVEYETGHSKTETKLLTGRQLFIAKEMHSLKTTGKQLELPLELCIMLVDELQNPLEGELWLRYLKDAEWLDAGKEELATGNWLFSQIPAGQEAYRPYGEAVDYFDPELPEHQFMTEQEIKVYHYHALSPSLLLPGQFRVFPDADKEAWRLKVKPEGMAHFEAINEYPHTGLQDYLYNDTLYLSAGETYYFTLPDELLEPIDWIELHEVYRSSRSVVDPRTYMDFAIAGEGWAEGLHWHDISTIWKEKVWRYPAEGEPPLNWPKASLQSTWLRLRMSRYDEPEGSRLEATQFFMLVQGRIA